MKIETFLFILSANAMMRNQLQELSENLHHMITWNDPSQNDISNNLLPKFRARLNYPEHCLLLNKLLDI